MKIALSIIAVFFIFVSCSKTNFAEYRKSPGIDLRFCNIKSWSDIHGDEQRTNFFTYNEYENPVSVISNQSGTGSGHHLFSYDDQQRLVGYEYEFVFIKQFKYEGSSRRSHGAQVTDFYGRE